MSQKRKPARDRTGEDLLEAMRYVLLAPPVLEDILPQIEAAFREMKELEALKQNTPASERTPEWESEHKSRMRACSKRFNALIKRWEEFNASFDSPGLASRH